MDTQLDWMKSAAPPQNHSLKSHSSDDKPDLGDTILYQASA